MRGAIAQGGPIVWIHYDDEVGRVVQTPVTPENVEKVLVEVRSTVEPSLARFIS